MQKLSLIGKRDEQVGRNSKILWGGSLKNVTKQERPTFSRESSKRERIERMREMGQFKICGKAVA